MTRLVNVINFSLSQSEHNRDFYCSNQDQGHCHLGEVKASEVDKVVKGLFLINR
jgi:hypothetical protein